MTNSSSSMLSSFMPISFLALGIDIGSAPISATVSFFSFVLFGIANALFLPWERYQGGRFVLTLVVLFRTVCRECMPSQRHNEQMC
jgi:hypothetical protein